MKKDKNKPLLIKDIPGLADLIKEKQESIAKKWANIDWKLEAKKLEKRHAENVYKQWRIKQLEESGSELDKMIATNIVIDDIKKLINTFIAKKKDLDFEGRAYCTELIRAYKLLLKRLQHEQKEETQLRYNNKNNMIDTSKLGNEERIALHASNIAGFINIATRYSFNTTPDAEKLQVSALFEPHISVARDYYELFKRALKEELKNPATWKVQQIDLRHKFLPIIEFYFNWYKEHKEEKKKFNPYNPYEQMYGIMVSTMEEIQKYFPEDSKVENGKKYTGSPFKTRPDLFTSEKGHLIFEKLIKTQKKRPNDYYVFIIRQLVKDGFMHDVKLSVYKKFMDEYEISLDKFKSLEIVSNDERLTLYSIIKDSIQ